MSKNITTESYSCKDIWPKETSHRWPGRDFISKDTSWFWCKENILDNRNVHTEVPTGIYDD